MLNKIQKNRSKIIFIAVSLVFFGWARSSQAADSELFPPHENAPSLASYVSGGVFAHTYYISPAGNDATGDGSIGNPWLSFNGATSGGSGTPVGPGDLIYARGGNYPTHVQTAWKESYYALKRSGISDNYIVITKYPDETPIFGGGDGEPSFSIHGNYVVIDNLTFAGGAVISNSLNSGGSFYFQNADYGVAQNNTFLGECGDPWGDQITGACIGLNDNVDHINIRNNYFAPSTDSHAIKSYTSVSIVNNVTIKNNRFYNNDVGYGVINIKSAMNAWEIAANRFENCRRSIVFGTTYNQGTHTNINIHHNAFDNVYVSIFDRLGTSTGEILNVSFHDNIVLNAKSDARNILTLRCDDSACMNSGTQAMGEFYNNAFYDILDAINPQTTSNFINYPSYWNYNAYSSAAIRDTAENQNSLPASSWQDSVVITPGHNITYAGISGDRLYSISDTSPFKNAGRYGDNIGGFVFSNADTTSPAAPQGLSAQ